MLVLCGGEKCWLDDFKNFLKYLLIQFARIFSTMPAEGMLLTSDSFICCIFISSSCRSALHCICIAIPNDLRFFLSNGFYSSRARRDAFAAKMLHNSVCYVMFSTWKKRKAFSILCILCFFLSWIVCGRFSSFFLCNSYPVNAFFLYNFPYLKADFCIIFSAALAERIVISCNILKAHISQKKIHFIYILSPSLNFLSRNFSASKRFHVEY